MRARRRAIRYALAATPIGAALILAGCQSDHVQGAKVDRPAAPGPAQSEAASAGEQTSGAAHTNGSKTVSISWKQRDVGGESYAPILAAYKAFIATTLTLEGAPNPSDPRINEVAGGQAQQNLVKTLTDMQGRHLTRHGSVTMRPWIIDADPTAGTATIEECADFSHYFQGSDDKPNAASQRRPIEAKLSDASGDWQVTSFAQGGANACTGVS